MIYKGHLGIDKLCPEVYELVRIYKWEMTPDDDRLLHTLADLVTQCFQDPVHRRSVEILARAGSSCSGYFQVHEGNRDMPVSFIPDERAQW